MTCRLAIRLTPRAARDEVIGFAGDVLRVHVTAPPVDGRANEALLRLLAKRLDVSRSALEFVSGESARQKVVAIAGLECEDVRSRLDVTRQ